MPAVSVPAVSPWSVSARAPELQSSPVNDLQLVIFDCDGVLVDSEVISNEVLATALSAEGLPTTLTEARRDYQGLLLADVASSAQEKLGRALPGDWLERYEHERNEAFRRELEPVPGSADAVRRISAAGLSVCVASQGTLEKIQLTLELTGLRELFGGDALFSAYSVARGKPHPDLFLHAAAAMNATPAASVVVEDTPSGVRAAVSAGMRVFGYAADSDEPALRGEGAEILLSLDELPPRLGL
jgi:HAD superfamily hydrolase (TIGR01509 family)